MAHYARIIVAIPILGILNTWKTMRWILKIVCLICLVIYCEKECIDESTGECNQTATVFCNERCVISLVEKKYVRNALKWADFSKSSVQKPYTKMRWNVLKCAETLQETRWKPLSFQKIGINENWTLLSGAVAFTLPTAQSIPEFFNFILY